MSILPQHKYPFKSLCRVRACHHPCLPNNVYCSATTTTTTIKSERKTTKLTIEPQILTPSIPITTTDKRRPVLNDPSLQSTWSHRAWVASGCATVLTPLAKSVATTTATADLQMWVQPTLAGLAGYILADLFSGFYHWAIDNYGDASTPIVGTQIEAFQGHHRWPRAITRRQFANNLHALARSVTFTVVPMNLVCNDPALQAFVGVCSGSIMFSQQFHAWAHGTKSRLPPPVVALQDAGVLVSRWQHAAHHRPPFNNNYCIVSGVWNELLDKHRVFEALEMVLFFKLGVRPRSWSEPSMDWTEKDNTL